MPNYVGIGFFVGITFVLVVIVMLLLFYIKQWLCFKDVPRFWCLENNYEELFSIPATEDEKSRWRDVESEDDANTVAAEEISYQKMILPETDNTIDPAYTTTLQFGTVDISFNYETEKTSLLCKIENVISLPNKASGGPSDYQLFVKLFNDSGRTLKKWRSRLFEVNNFPKDQKFIYTNLLPANVLKTALRFRLYGCERKKIHALLGETIIGLLSINFERESVYHIKLESTAILTLKDNNGDKEEGAFEKEARLLRVCVQESNPNQSELLIGLAYNKLNGRLTIHIVKGNALKHPLSKSDDDNPNTFVKMTLCATNTHVLAKSKTAIRVNEQNPHYMEKFIFNVPFFQLEEVSVVFAAYHTKSIHRREVIGWFSIGINNSSIEEKTHWTSMLEACGKAIYQWHLLLPTTKSRHGLPGAE